MTRLPRLVIIAVFFACFAAGQVGIDGRVLDDSGVPLPNARISTRVDAKAAPVTAESGPTGGFRLSLPAAGTYLVTVEQTGYFVLADQPVEVDAPNTRLTLVLTPKREVFQSVDVGESASPIDPAQTNREQRLNGTEVNNIPYPATQSFKNSLKLIPGVIQDPSAGVHFHGGAEYQTQYTLNGFDITDPITGHFNTVLAVEGIRTVEVQAARETAQYGHGSAGAMTVRIENGTNEYHYTATNFIPGLDTRNGFGIGAWSPRAGFSGPIVKDRAWFSDSITGGYSSGVVTGLPHGQNTNTAWSAGNLFHAQVNLTQSNFLFGDLLTNYASTAHSGLGPLDPIQTTTSQYTDEYLGAIKDSQAWRSGAYLEVGAALLRVYRKSNPQGPNPYVISPSGRNGNYFVNSKEHGERKELFANFFPPAMRWLGRHQVQTGVDYQHLDYTADFNRTTYVVLGLDGLPEYSTSFVGSGNYHIPNSSVGTYINDHWTPVTSLAIDVGIRDDWDRLIGRNALGPRAAAAWSPSKESKTKLVAGWGVLYDATNLATFAPPYDQRPVTTPYSPLGIPGVPYITNFLPGNNLRLPRYDQMSAGVEHDFGHRIYASADWLRKRGRDGLVYAPVAGAGAPVEQQFYPGAENGGTYALASIRRDRYDEYAVTVRQSLKDQYEWMASYVHSQAVSNAVLGINVDQTLQVTNNFGPMPWDAPNRFLSTGYLPVYFKNWAISYLADWRTGFPFSVVDPTNRVLGPVDSHRYPSNFDLNIHVERRFDFFGYRFAIRVGANNVTDHANPTAVNNVVGAPNYTHFYGFEGRHVVVRIRLFGRVK